VMAAMEIGPSHMPQFPYVLSVPEMRAVAGYVTQDLATISLAGGDLNEGGHLFRIYCSACHTAAARGGALAFTGVNAPDIAGKSAAIIAGAIRWGPGPMPPFPASVINDQQLDSIVEYVRFLRQPPSPGGTPLHWLGPVAEGFVAWIVMFGLVMVSGWIEKGGKG
jgi:ubiquinol-cytochrome c reductase cytochrome c subunit